MCLFCVCVVLCSGRGLETGWSLVQGVLPSLKMIIKLKKHRPGPKGGCRASGKKNPHPLSLCMTCKTLERNENYTQILQLLRMQTKLSDFSQLSLFWKKKRSALMRSPCCLCVCVPSYLKLETETCRASFGGNEYTRNNRRCSETVFSMRSLSYQKLNTWW
jgi:hypothetical protein